MALFRSIFSWLPSRGNLLCAILFAAAIAGCADRRDEDLRADADTAADDHPRILMQNVRCQITKQGVLSQEIKAAAGNMDQKEDILDLTQLNVKFYDGATSKGQASGGFGRVWLKDRPAEKISSHDVLLREHVLYQTPEGWLLQTPEMRYTSADSMLRSDKGYVQQMPTKDGWLVGRGNRFEIELNLEQKTFKSWTGYGTPAVFDKSKRPELKP